MPQLGASFGVLIWAPVGCFVACWLFAEHPLRLRFVLLVVGASMVLSALVLMADLAFNPFPHLPNMSGYLEGGPIALLCGVFAEVQVYSLATVVYSPILTILFILTIVWMMVLAFIKPGSYNLFWARNRGFRAVYTGGLAVMILMCFFEDSGIFMPALFLANLLPGFIWLVCDMHTWRGRVMQTSGETITIRDLMRLALTQETYRKRFAELQSGGGTTPLSSDSLTNKDAATDAATVPVKDAARDTAEVPLKDVANGESESSSSNHDVENNGGN
jgi:hypothetical protein